MNKLKHTEETDKLAEEMITLKKRINHHWNNWRIREDLVNQYEQMTLYAITDLNVDWEKWLEEYYFNRR